MKNNHIKVLFFNFLFVLSVISTFIFTKKFEPELVDDILSAKFDGLGTFFIILGIHFTILVILFLKAGKSQSRIADSELLTYKELNKEQNRARNTVFLPKNHKYFKKDKSALSISRNVKLSTKKTYEHLLLIGPTGSGKSASFFLPNLLNLDKTSIVTTDPKGELHRKSRESLLQKGYRVIHLNFNNPRRSARYNLLANAKSYDDIRKISDSIMGNDEWANMSKNLLEAFLFDEFDCHEKNISNVVDRMAQNLSLEELEEYFRDSSYNANLSFQKFLKTSGNDKGVASIYLTINAKMKVFEFDNVRDLGSTSDFSPADFRKEKTALFVSYPEDESTVYAPFLASFYYQLFNQIKADKSVDESYGRATGYGVIFLLDEAANIGKIPELDVLLATIRSKKMSIVMGIQSFDQLKKVYKDTYNIIAENCKTKVILGGSTGETARFFSGLVGEEEYTNMSHSSGQSRDLSTTYSTQKKNILSSDQIRRLKSYELLCVGDNLKPFQDDKNYYFLDHIGFWLFKHLPFSNEFNESIINKYNSIRNRKPKESEAPEQPVRKEIHQTHNNTSFQSYVEERKPEAPQMRQEQPTVATEKEEKEDEIQKILAQRKNRF